LGVKSVSKVNYSEKLSGAYVPLQADLTVLTNPDNPLVADLDMTGIKVEDRKLLGEQNCTLVIACNVLHHTTLLHAASSALADGACILAREDPDTKCVSNNNFGFEVVFEKTLGDEKFVLLRKVCRYMIM
jgi:hypothetical protein